MIVLKNVDIFNDKLKIEKGLNIAVKNGKIIDIFPKGVDKKEYSSFQHIDCSGCIVSPSFVDLHTHLREPGFEYKETIHTGALSAKAGGFTDICCMANTSPVADNESVIKFIKEQGDKTGINVYPVAAITVGLKGEKLTEFGHLIDAGAVAFSDDGVDVPDSFLMKTAFEYAAFFKKPVFCHCEDKNLAGNGVMNDGLYSTLAGLRGIPSVSEEVNVFRNIKIAEYSKARVHICHVSTLGAVDIAERAKQRGVNVSLETCPHYLTLADEDVYKSGYNTCFKMNPPLRTGADVEALIDALNKDTIDCIATDHAPHAVHEKSVEFEYAPFGIIGLELAFPVCFQLVDKGKIAIEKLLSKFTVEPADIIGIEKKGVCIGSKADIVVIDMETEKQVTEKSIVSKSKNTPFIGRTFKGWAVMTFSKGKVVYSNIQRHLDK
jgi:dihydroorotase